MLEDPWLRGLIKGGYIKQTNDSRQDGNCGATYGADCPPPWTSHADWQVEADGKRLEFWDLSDEQYDDQLAKLAAAMVFEQTSTAQAKFRRAKFHRLSGDWAVLSIYQVISIDAAFLKEK